MAMFAYKARLRSGKLTQGKITAESKQKAKIKLINKGYRVLKITAVLGDGEGPSEKKTDLQR